MHKIEEPKAMEHRGRQLLSRKGNKDSYQDYIANQHL